jgi:hypothetical protein
MASSAADTAPRASSMRKLRQVAHRDPCKPCSNPRAMVENPAK